LDHTTEKQERIRSMPGTTKETLQPPLNREYRKKRGCGGGASEGVRDQENGGGTLVGVEERGSGKATGNTKREGEKKRTGLQSADEM